MSDISSFDPNAVFNQYSPYGRDYGNPLVNAGMFASFGYNYAPKPEGNEDYTDAEIVRLRSREFMTLQGSAFSNNMLFKQAGFDPSNHLLQLLGRAAGTPDGAVSRMLSPLIGGNPVAATQQVFAGLQGGNIMGAFGRTGGVSVPETERVMKSLEEGFYHKKPFESQEAIGGKMDRDFAQHLVRDPSYGLTHDENGDLGVPRRDDGQIDQERVEALKAQGASQERELKGIQQSASTLFAPPAAQQVHQATGQAPSQAPSVTHHHQHDHTTNINSSESLPQTNPLVNAGMAAAFGYNYIPKPGEHTAHGHLENIPQQATHQTPQQAAQQHIEESLKKTFNISDQDLAAAKDEHGKLKKESVDKLVEQAKERTIALKSGIDPDKMTGKPAVEGVGAEMDREFAKKLLHAPEFARQHDSDGSFGVPRKSDGTVDEKAVSRMKHEGKEEGKLLDDLKKDYEALYNNEGKRGTKEFSEKVSKSAQDHVEDILKKVAGATDEELKKAKDKNGVLDKKAVDKMLERGQDYALAKQAGVDPKKLKGLKLGEIADKIHDSQVNRVINNARVTREAQNLDKYQTQIKEVEEKKSKLGWGSVFSDEGQDLNAERNGLNQKFERSNKVMVDTLKDMGVEEKDIKYKTVDGGKRIDPDWLKTKQGELMKHDYVVEEAERYRKFKEVGGKYGGINFENTRGFTIEDFTSGFKTAADLRILGGKGSPEQKMSQFVHHGGAVMEAARGVFGDKSSSELLRLTSGLVDNKADISTKEGAGAIEATLRKVKATARVAGMSIDTMVQIIEAGKMLARANPKLATISSQAVTDMSMKAVQTTTAMAGVAGSATVREMGGTQAMVGGLIAEDQKVLSTDTARGLTGLQAAYAGDPEKLAAVQHAIKYRNEHGGLNAKTLGLFYNELSEEKALAGESKVKFSNYMTSEQLANEGLKNTEFSNLAKDTTKAGFKTELFEELFNNKAVNISHEGFDPTKQSKGEFMAEQSAKEIKKMQAAAKAKGQTLTTQAAWSTLTRDDVNVQNASADMQYSTMQYLTQKMDPGYYAKVEKMRDQQASLDTRMSKKFAARNAPVITQAISALAEGDSTEETTKKLLSIFSQETGYDKNKASDVQEHFADVISNAGTGKTKEEAEALSKALSTIGDKKVDISEEEIGAIADVSSNYTGDTGTKDAKQDLAKFRKIKEAGGKMSEADKHKLQGLEAMEKTGIIDSKEAIETVKQGADKGNAGMGVAAGAVAAQRQATQETSMREQRYEMFTGKYGQDDVDSDGKVKHKVGEVVLDEKGQKLEGIDAQFDQQIASGDTKEKRETFSAVKDYYMGAAKKDPKNRGKSEAEIRASADELMYADSKTPGGAGLFSTAGQEEFKKKKGIDLSDEAHQDAMEAVKAPLDLLKQADDKVAGPNGKDPQAEMTEQLKALLGGMNKSNLVDALQALVRKI